MDKRRSAWLWLWLALALAFAAGCAGASAQTVSTAEQAKSLPGLIQIDAASVPFKPGPASMPTGVELAVLEGDPKQTGMFTLRLKAPPGFLLAPHTHPVDERVTVISGSIGVGFGSVVHKAQARVFKAGGFYVNPPGAVHYVFSDEGAVVQITGMGPWKVELK